MMLLQILSLVHIRVDNGLTVKRKPSPHQQEFYYNLQHTIQAMRATA